MCPVSIVTGHNGPHQGVGKPFHPHSILVPILFRARHPTDAPGNGDFQHALVVARGAVPSRQRLDSARFDRRSSFVRARSPAPQRSRHGSGSTAKVSLPRGCPDAVHFPKARQSAPSTAAKMDTWTAVARKGGTHPRRLTNVFTRTRSGPIERKARFDANRFSPSMLTLSRRVALSLPDMRHRGLPRPARCCNGRSDMRVKPHMDVRDVIGGHCDCGRDQAARDLDARRRRGGRDLDDRPRQVQRAAAL
jgi:hypothetical protein